MPGSSAKGYGDVSEYFGSLMREALQKEADAGLEALLLEGLASDSIPLNDEFWQRFKVKTEQIRQKYAGRTQKKAR
jgi:antitoxin ParD1/3/4